jgi:hypothetical protein
MRRRLEQKFAGQVEFGVEPCEEIALSPRGKAIYIDQRIEGIAELLEKQGPDEAAPQDGGLEEARSTT